MSPRDPRDPTLGEEIAFQVLQIAEAQRRGHPSPAALARFHARARANLAALTRPASSHDVTLQGDDAWPEKQEHSA